MRSDMIKMLVISCSPRKNGNTELLLKEAIRGASNEGAEAEFVRLQELDIKPCRECLSCHTDGKCVVNDDMQKFYDKLINMDAIILGSPIFFMGIPAQGKAFIDRCQPFWAMKYLLRQQFFPKEKSPRKGAFISVGGRAEKNNFGPAVSVVKSFFAVTEVEYKDEILLGGIDAEGQILKHPEALKQSYDLGAGLVRCARSVVERIKKI